MHRSQLEHLIRAASAIIESDDVIVIGSQAILASYAERVLPKVLTMSIEADILPLTEDIGRSADLIDGSIGEASMFHDTYGIYAQGVTFGTALLAEGWTHRLVPLVDRRTGSAVGWCLDVHDLCASKLLASRPKDIEFVSEVVRARLADPDEVIRLLDVTDVDTSRRESAKTLMTSWKPMGLPETESAAWWRRRRSALRDRLRQAPRQRPLT